MPATSEAESCSVPISVTITLHETGTKSPVELMDILQAKLGYGQM